MNLGITLALGGVCASGVWTPAQLFSIGAFGAYYDVQDLSTLFVERTTPTTNAAVGDRVGTMLDKSPNGLHLMAPTDSARPVLQQSGSTYYLEFDGLDDDLDCVFPAKTYSAYTVMATGNILTTGSTANDDLLALANTVNANPLVFIRRRSTSVQAGYRSVSGSDVTAVWTVGLGSEADGVHVWSNVIGVAPVLYMDAVIKATGSAVGEATTVNSLTVGALRRSEYSNWAPARFYAAIVIIGSTLDAVSLANARVWLANNGGL